MSKDHVRSWVQTIAPVLTLLMGGVAFYVTAKAEDKAQEAVKPVEARVAQIEKEHAELKATLANVATTLQDIKNEQKTTREDVKEILRHQRRQ